MLLHAVNAETTSPKVSLALDILAEEGYMNPRESVQSREMRTAPGFNICFEKRLRKSSLFSAVEEDLKVTQPQNSKLNRASERHSEVQTIHWTFFSI